LFTILYLFTDAVDESVISEHFRIGYILEERCFGEILACQFLNEVCEDEAYHWSHDLTNVCARLLGLKLTVFQKKGFELRALF